jgi:hypothetical protein
MWRQGTMWLDNADLGQGLTTQILWRDKKCGCNILCPDWFIFFDFKGFPSKLMPNIRNLYKHRSFDRFRAVFVFKAKQNNVKVGFAVQHSNNIWPEFVKVKIKVFLTKQLQLSPAKKLSFDDVSVR